MTCWHCQSDGGAWLHSPEGKDKGFSHLFLLSFDSESQRDAYLPSAQHQAYLLNAQTVPAKDVLVVDWLPTAVPAMAPQLTGPRGALAAAAAGHMAPVAGLSEEEQEQFLSRGFLIKRGVFAVDAF
jgi:hypothetical protein